MLDIFIGIIIGFIIGFFALSWVLTKSKVYLGATYTNGYRTVIVDALRDNRVIYYDVDYEDTTELDIKTFVLQFKLKDTQGE